MFGSGSPVLLTTPTSRAGIKYREPPEVIEPFWLHFTIHSLTYTRLSFSWCPRLPGSGINLGFLARCCADLLLQYFSFSPMPLQLRVALAKYTNHLYSTLRSPSLVHPPALRRPEQFASSKGKTYVVWGFVLRRIYVVEARDVVPEMRVAAVMDRAVRLVHLFSEASENILLCWRWYFLS